MNCARWLACVAAMLSAVVVGLSLAGSAAAATNVTCTNGASDQTTLQNAINGGGVVLIHGHCLGNWTVTNNVTLTGVGGAVLDGGNVSSVLLIEFATVTINTLTIENGLNGNGGGILAGEATVNVNNSTITANSAEGGGGIFAEFSLVNLNGATVSHNTADVGGGVFAADLTMSVTNSSIVNNTAFIQGGGVATLFADVALIGTRISSNSAGEGGGIASFGAGGSVELRPAAVWASQRFPVPAVPELPGVTAAAAVRPAASPDPGSGLTLTNSSVDHNTAEFAGGGIFNIAEFADSPVTLTSSSVNYNRVTAFSQVVGSAGGGGGGIFNAGTDNAVASMIATGSQIRGNLARNSVGGGVLNDAESGGSALVSLASTSVSPASGTLNPNQAEFGGGIYNSGDGADITVAGGGSIVRNVATVTGGGIFSECDGTVSILPGAVIMLNNPNNIINDPTSCDG
jgi:hypothetical protein